MTRSTPAERRAIATALPPLNDADHRVIERFLDAMWAEHGLAVQTQSAYRRDLAGFARWLGADVARASKAHVYDYLAWRARHGYAPRSDARLHTVLRGFFGWCVRGGLRVDDPAAHLDAPRLPRSLPKALAESEIEALLAAPDIDTSAGLRDRTMLELMYAAGLRVS